MSSPTLPYAFAKNHGVLVSVLGADGATILLREDADPAILSEVRRNLGVPLTVELISRPSFDTHLAQLYDGGANNAAEVVADVGQEVDLTELMAEMPAVEDLLESQDDAPIIRMINALLTQAVREGASDVHIEPYERYSVVRFRRDGVLRDIAQPHRGLHAAMVSRIKIMAHLDIAEKRLPQDGRIGLRLAGRTVDVRLSTLPTTHGERIVMRLLDKSTGQFGLEKLGMGDDTRRQFQQLLQQPHGILLVTGPTGSGKSTTLYAALQTLDTKELNIITVEDPVEYDLAGIGQIQVNPRIELTFARALRAILRQDPDVIMIGEIRDLETAQIAVQASLTGHLVLATLHTNDAASAITRLIDMGVEPFLLASTLRGVLAQRLVRRLCPKCAETAAITPAEHALLGQNSETLAQLYHANGCESCSQTGYAGRAGVYELIRISDDFAKQVHEGADEAQLRTFAQTHGTRSLRQDGLRHLAQGTTSLEELMRVTKE